MIYLGVVFSLCDVYVANRIWYVKIKEEWWESCGVDLKKSFGALVITVLPINCVCEPTNVKQRHKLVFSCKFLLCIYGIIYLPYINLYIGTSILLSIYDSSLCSEIYLVSSIVAIYIYH